MLKRKKFNKYSFVIITPGRSASEHLSETLSNYSDLTMEGEIFNRSNCSDESFNRFLQTKLSYKILAFFFNREKLSNWEINFPMKFIINHFLKCNSVLSRKTGFKLTLDQINSYPFVLSYILRNKIKIIYLFRKDLLALTLSLIKARRMQYYQTRIPETSASLFSFDVEEVKTNYFKIKNWEINLLNLLPEKLSFLLSYEELFKQYEQKLFEIRDFLNLKRVPTPEVSDIRKINPMNLESWVENLNEIKEALGFNKAG